MSQHLKHTAGSIALALGLGTGCGGQPPATPMAGDPQAIDASISQSLERLRALGIFSAGNLVLKLPAEATSCYGLPCPGSSWVVEYQQERARQAPRLATLADVTERVSHDPYLEPRAWSEQEAAMKALADLQVVEVGGIIEVKPQNNPSCYNLPCESDQQAAAAENSRRIAEAFAIADEAKARGL